jgi:hypothetical protein
MGGWISFILYHSLMKTVRLFMTFFLLSIFLVNVSLAQAPAWLWAKSSSGWGLGYSVAEDASGNYYVTGTFISTTITFESYTLAQTGGDDIFLVKYDGNGNVLWARSAGGSDNDEALSVAVDASGNAFIAGVFRSSTITFGSHSLTNSGLDDMFIVKYDTAGNVLWAQSGGGTAFESALSVCVDASGNALATGSFTSSTITFGSFTLTNKGVGDIFLVKYNAMGIVLWAKNEGGTNDDIGYSVASDASGNFYMTGYFSNDNISVGPYTLTNSGSTDILVVKYNSAGEVVWAKDGGGTQDDRSYSMTVDAAGSVYVTGTFSSPVINFGSHAMSNSGVVDMFIVKYDVNGDELWANNAIGIYSDEAWSVAAEASGNSLVTGWFDSPSITFGSHTLINSGSSDIFLVRYDASGNTIWADAIGGAQGENGFSVAMDNSGDAVVTGSFLSPEITFGSYTILNQGSNPVFIAKAKWIYTGIDEAENSNNISVYPNPATETITIKVPEGNTKGHVRIENIDGVEILQRGFFESTATIDISDLPRGFYFIRIMGERSVQVAKFVKQ